MEMLVASAATMAAATVDQSKDNKTHLDNDMLKKLLVKNLTEEQQLLMGVVLGGDFTSQPAQNLADFNSSRMRTSSFSRTSCARSQRNTPANLI